MHAEKQSQKTSSILQVTALVVLSISKFWAKMFTRNLSLKYQLHHTGASDRILYILLKTQHWECIYHVWALHTGCKIVFLRALLLKFGCSNIKKLNSVGREERIFSSHAAIPRQIHLPVSSAMLGGLDKRLFLVSKFLKIAILIDVIIWVEEY